MLITGSTEQEHLQNLEEVLQRLKQWGFRLKKRKCHLVQTFIECLGSRVDAEGLHTTTSKVEAVLNSPQPTDVRQLWSF